MERSVTKPVVVSNLDVDADENGALILDSVHGLAVIMFPQKEARAAIKDLLKPELIAPVIASDPSQGLISHVGATTFCFRDRPWVWRDSVPLDPSPQGYQDFLMQSQRAFAFFSWDDAHLLPQQRVCFKKKMILSLISLLQACILATVYPRPKEMAALLAAHPSLTAFRLPGCRLTLFEASVRRGYLQTAQVIFDANVAEARSSSLPIHWLAFTGNVQAIEIFEKKGFAIDAPVPRGKDMSFEQNLRPIDVAALNGMVRCVSYLLDRLPAGSVSDESLLQMVSKESHKELAALLRTRRKTTRVCDRCAKTLRFAHSNFCH